MDMNSHDEQDYQQEDILDILTSSSDAIEVQFRFVPSAVARAMGSSLFPDEITPEEPVHTAPSALREEPAPEVTAPAVQDAVQFITEQMLDEDEDDNDADEPEIITPARPTHASPPADPGLTEPQAELRADPATEIFTDADERWDDIEVPHSFKTFTSSQARMPASPAFNRPAQSIPATAQPAAVNSPVFCPPVPSCRIFRGRVSSRSSGEPIFGVRVTAGFGFRSITELTDEYGCFCISMPGSWNPISLRLEKQGFDSRYIGTVSPLRGQNNFTLIPRF